MTLRPHPPVMVTHYMRRVDALRPERVAFTRANEAEASGSPAPDYPDNEKPAAISRPLALSLVNRWNRGAAFLPPTHRFHYWLEE